jgi:hypothetical protein
VVIQWNGTLQENASYIQTRSLQHLSKMKNAVFWDVTPCGSRISISSKRASVASYCYVVPSSLILVILMMEAIRSYETSVLIRATQRHISQDGIPHSHRR